MDTIIDDAALDAGLHPCECSAGWIGNVCQHPDFANAAPVDGPSASAPSVPAPSAPAPSVPSAPSVDAPSSASTFSWYGSQIDYCAEHYCLHGGVCSADGTACLCGTELSGSR